MPQERYQDPTHLLEKRIDVSAEQLIGIERAQLSSRTALDDLPILVRILMLGFETSNYVRELVRYIRRDG